jgi:hypothetical protein
MSKVRTPKLIPHALLVCPVDGPVRLVEVSVPDNGSIIETCKKELGMTGLGGLDWGDVDFTNNTFHWTQIQKNNILQFNLNATIIVRYLRGRKLSNILLDQNSMFNNCVIMLKGKALEQAQKALQFHYDTKEALKIIWNLMSASNSTFEDFEDEDFYLTACFVDTDDPLQAKMDTAIESYLNTWGTTCKSKIKKEELVDFVQNVWTFLGVL